MRAWAVLLALGTPAIGGAWAQDAPPPGAVRAAEARLGEARRLAEAGEHAAAARRYEEAAGLLSDPQAAVAAWLMAGREHAAAGAPDAAQRALRSLRMAHGADPRFHARVIESYVVEAQAWRAQGALDEARSAAQAAVREHAEGDAEAGDAEAGDAEAGDAARHAAHARFLLVDMDFDDWAAIALSGSTADFKARMEAKKAGMSAAAEALRQIVALRDAAWTVAAIYRTGSFHEGFAAFLTAAPCPTDLPAERCPAFARELAAVAAGLTAQARGHYEQAVALASAPGVDGPWGQRAARALAALDGGGAGSVGSVANEADETDETDEAPSPTP